MMPKRSKGKEEIKSWQRTENGSAIYDVSMEERAEGSETQLNTMCFEEYLLFHDIPIQLGPSPDTGYVPAS